MIVEPLSKLEKFELQILQNLLCVTLEYGNNKSNGITNVIRATYFAHDLIAYNHQQNIQLIKWLLWMNPFKPAEIQYLRLVFFLISNMLQMVLPFDPFLATILQFTLSVCYFLLWLLRKSTFVAKKLQGMQEKNYDKKWK